MDPGEEVGETLANHRVFSGKGRLSNLAAKAGFAAASFDINHLPSSRNHGKRKRPFDKRRPMDINGEIGFSLLDFTKNLLLLFDFYSFVK